MENSIKIEKTIYAKIDVAVKKYVISWTIGNFDFFEDYNKLSQVFNLDHDSVKFCSLNFGIKNDYSYLKVSFKDVTSSIRTKIKINVVVNGEVIKSNVKMVRLYPDYEYTSITNETIFTYPTSSRTPKLPFLSDDVLTFHCDIGISDGEVLISTVSSGDDMESLSNDFDKLLKDQKHGDVTFNVGNEKFLLHKAILAVRSPVFSAMFEHNMSEKNLNEVHITDFEPEIMSEMFRYMYLGKVKLDCFHTAQNLYFAADKYGLKGLKNKCRVALMQLMKPEDTALLKDLAERCNDKELKMAL